MRLRCDDGRWRELLGTGLRIEGTQQVGQVCFGSVRAAKQNRQKQRVYGLEIIHESSTAASERRAMQVPDECRNAAGFGCVSFTASTKRRRLGKWSRRSRRRFDHNAGRLQIHAVAFNLCNFMRTLALPDAVEQWWLTTLREKLVKIGAKIVHHGRYVDFQMAEVAVPKDLYADIPRRIVPLRPSPAPA